MRFTIRDTLMFLTAVGLTLAWWSDHRELAFERDKLKADYLNVMLRLIPLESFPQGAQRISQIHDLAKQSPPAPEAAAEVFHYIRFDPDFRIKARAMAVCPYLNERKEAIAVLVTALRERDSIRSGDGTVNAYAAKYLADMKAVSAVEDMKSWLHYLRHETPYDGEVRSELLKR